MKTIFEHTVGLVKLSKSIFLNSQSISPLKVATLGICQTPKPHFLKTSDM